MSERFAHAFRRFDRVELGICRCLNRSSGVAAVRRLFSLASLLGDGWFWYALIALLPFMYGREGLAAAVQMGLTSFVGIAAYKLVKNRAVRERPYITHHAISCITAPLDRYSFPSGHTLHAVCFTLLMTSHFPQWMASLCLFALLVALSRIALGLHYPTDVAAGAVLGAVIGGASLETGKLLAALFAA
ncbi:MAG TPA: phosphatase PAP2 family protein [Gammaproteobacteria bacterium]|nr:phosphatase PAP2 family protein [Gammaproteobacteria bacterium]